MSGKETYMIETLTRDMIARLMEERNMTMHAAMDLLYHSKVYAALTNLATGLYYQSAAYLYDELSQELSA